MTELLPSVVVAYAVYALFLACVGLFAVHAVASALIRGPDLLAQLVFTPLLAGWSIWIAIAISTRSSDPRTAQHLGALAALPSVAVTTLIALGVIQPSLRLSGLVRPSDGYTRPARDITGTTRIREHRLVRWIDEVLSEPRGQRRRP